MFCPQFFRSGNCALLILHSFNQLLSIFESRLRKDTLFQVLQDILDNIQVGRVARLICPNIHQVLALRSSYILHQSHPLFP